MKKFLILALVVMLNTACTTKYVLMDEDNNPVKGNDYTEEFYVDNGETVYGGISQNRTASANRTITANDVFAVDEGDDYVVYQYKNVRVDEISPLASMYCADIAKGASPYLREVQRYHSGFMRATFDCVNLAK